jgi:hypothetical protein
VGNGTTLFNNLTVDLMDQIMDFPVDPIMAAKAYKYKAEILLKEYLLADSYVLYTSVLAGLLMCKLVLLFLLIVFYGLVAYVCALVYAAKIKIGINGEFASSNLSCDVFELCQSCGFLSFFCWCRVR